MLTHDLKPEDNIENVRTKKKKKKKVTKERSIDSKHDSKLESVDKAELEDYKANKNVWEGIQVSKMNPDIGWREWRRKGVHRNSQIAYPMISVHTS